MRRPSILGLVVVLTAASCGMPYQRRGPAGGYAEVELEPGVYRVEYLGQRGAPRDLVETYGLYRCAELAVTRGYERFVVMNSYTEARDDPVVLAGQPVVDPQSRTVVGVTAPMVLPGVRYVAIITIRLLRADPPGGGADARDARRVLHELGPRIQRP